MSNNLHDLAQDAGKLAHDRLIDPAMNLMHEAKSAVQSSATQARDALSADVAQTQESLTRMCHATGRWISANPFTSVGLAVLAGVALTSAGRSTRG